MRKAYDLRKCALESLKGRWNIAVGVGFLAALLNGVNVSSVSLNIDLGDIKIEDLKFQVENIFDVRITETIHTIFLILIVSVIIFALAYSFLGCIINIGYLKFNLNLVDNKEVHTNILFQFFKNWKNIICKNLLELLYIFLWSLLLFIPGIIATYSYAMTNYILAEHQDISPNEAIRKSVELMKGNRMKLFSLQLSFIGWEILCILSFGIGYLWLTPYKQAAYAHFFREVSKNTKFRS